MGESRQALPTKEEIKLLPPDGGPEFNRLVFESSPYLLQHARNPVDWYPWGEDAFARARSENKPILVSIGYSTCYWCHVMERECFEDAEVAKILNEYYICVKVDREERPDIDALYMTAMQMMTGSSGWPCNVWLTADLKPWYAATYVPKLDGPFGEGFVSLTSRLAKKYEIERAAVDRMANEMLAGIQHSSVFNQRGNVDLPQRDQIHQVLRELSFAFDGQNGGVGQSPKFPPHGALALWAYEFRKGHDEKILSKLVKTLDGMARGGLRDHVGGGFHRYCTDSRWRVPHFEKMLYDNALLARAYCDGWLATGNTEYKAISQDALDWILEEMTSPEGGFYSAIDAESEGEEGRYYTFTAAEVGSVLEEKDLSWFAEVFSVEEGGNYLDEATSQRTGRNVLYRKRNLAEIAQAEGASAPETAERLDNCLRRLESLRQVRARPHVDDKVLLSWNALAISSLAYCGAHLEDSRYKAAAERCAQFIEDSMIREGKLCQSYRGGRAYGEAFLDGYAYLAKAYLDLYQAVDNETWLDRSMQLADHLLTDFQDEIGGGFYFTDRSGERLVSENKSAIDEATPSGNGIAAQVLARLAIATGRDEYSKAAEKTLHAFAGQMRSAPLATQSMYLALLMIADGTESDGAIVTKPTRSGEALPLPDAVSRMQPVTVELYCEQVAARPGHSIRMKVRLGLDGAYHVNSNAPLEDYLYPTMVSEGDESALELVSVSYPIGREMQLQAGLPPVSGYEDGTWIDLVMRVPTESTFGIAEAQIKVSLQPCDAMACQLIQEHKLVVAIDVSPEEEERRTGNELFSRRSEGSNARAGSRSALMTILSAMLLVLLGGAKKNKRR